MKISDKACVNARPDDGWALASVLWAVTMLSLMAAATQELTLVSHRTERRAWDATVADALFRTGLTKAVQGISASMLEDRWAVDGQARNIVIDGSTVRITIQIEAGRYDLNAVDGSILDLLFRDAGLDAEESAKLRDAVLDWRSATPGHQLNGATDADYAAAGLSYRPRHGAFLSIGELRLVLGMTRQIFDRVRPALTVYTRHTAIDPDYAPEPALAAFYGGNRDKAAAVIDVRENAATSGRSSSIPSGALRSGTSVAGQAFEILQEANISGRYFRRSVVVQLTGVSGRPYYQLGFE